MNRVAYRTTELAIKMLAGILKANSRFHDVSHIPDGPIIFVINHFTRLETILLPYYLYHLVKRPICSLADDGFFHGVLKSYFDRVGVLSTKDPHRDELIIRSLVTSGANWIIFPEGKMVKNKKLIRGKEFMIGDDQLARPPHSGPAWLGLRAEILRRVLLNRPDGLAETAACIAGQNGIGKEDTISTESVKIVPVNLTYYPLRSRENFLSDMAHKYVGAPTDRMIEELMAEGTMFLEGVDIDIRIGRSLDMAAYTDHQSITALLERPFDPAFDQCPKVDAYMKAAAGRIMHLYMERMYAATTVNHDHIQASLLRKRSFLPFSRSDFAGRAHLAVTGLQRIPELEGRLHKSLRQSQADVLTYDRTGKIGEFIKLGLESGFLVEDDQQRLLKEDDAWDQSPLMHEARIANIAEVMANEIEPLKRVQRCLLRVSRVPDRMVPAVNAYNLYRQDRQLYISEREAHAEKNEIEYESGRPFILPARSRRAGVVMIHSYLSVPEEIRECAKMLNRRGLWVYGVRLPGHGTCPESLARVELEDWRQALDRGVAVLNAACRQIFMVGFSVGGMLALEFASHYRQLAGVAAICPPFELADYSQRFMPSTDIWNRLLSRWKGNQYKQEFMDFEPENSTINYHRNPVAGVNQVGELLKLMKGRLEFVTQPTLVIAADNDQVIGAESAARVYGGIGAAKKEILKFHTERHNIIYGNHTGVETRVHEAVGSFLQSRIQ